MLPILLFIKFLIFTDIVAITNNRIFIALISVLYTLFIMTFINKANKKHTKTILLLFYISVSILLLVDATYYSQFNNYTSVALIIQISQLNTVGDSIKVLLNIKILALVLDIPLLITYYKSKEKDVRIGRPTIWGVTLLLMMGVFNVAGQLEAVKGQEFFTYHIVDIYKNIIKKNDTLYNNTVSNMDDKELELKIADIKNRSEKIGGKYYGLGKDKNLIVLQVEALQNFVIDLEYNGVEITPNFNKIIHDNSTIYYNNYYQLIGRGNTSDSEFVSQNSIYPSMKAPTYMQYPDNEYYGLPWLLRDNGYTAWVFHGYEKNYWNRDAAYKSIGFERFISQEDFQFEEKIGFGIRDEDFFDQSMDYLKELDKKDENPFYAFIITLSSHTPFNMEERYKELDILPEHKGTILGNYLDAIHYTDKQFGIFLEDLKTEGLYEDTIIALYGDHYAVLSVIEEDQRIMTDLLEENYDFDQMMNVPLAIHIPGQEIKENVTNVGSQLDFYPTIANIMGYKNEKGLIFGQDLNNSTKNYVFPLTYMTKGSVITKDKVFVMARDGIFKHSRAYDIDTKREIDIDRFKDISKGAIEEIDLSEYVLKMDILKTYK